jgi:hypothetical protein
VLGHVILSQDVHALYGGVVPEIASREHLRAIDDVVAGALREAGVTLHDVDAVAATAGPGLIGALLVGLTFGKALAFAAGRPFIAVHHMEAHLFATELDDAGAHPPFVALLVSGGHTMLLWVPEWGRYELLGQTRDDAAGEAFDKVAKILGLGYPGGPVIERTAAAGDPKRVSVPPGMLASNQQRRRRRLLRVLLQRPEDVGADAGAGAGRRASWTCDGPTSRRRSRPRWWTCSRPRSCARWSRSAAGASYWAAAWRPAARCASRWPRRSGADGELLRHRRGWPRTTPR